ncbi:MAG: SH3 domain-containing protein [Lachnospiraceae bacterium]|nr:SH3 domain-containing protein [Lachnospiraceae bacterium]
MKEFFSKNLRYIIIGVLFVILVVVVILFVNKKKTSDKIKDAATEELYQVDTGIEVPKDKYEVNAYPAVNTLLESYFNAIATGDADTVASLSNVLSDEERVRIQIQSKYFDNFSNYSVYTKVGPSPNSYLAMVTYDIKYAGVDTPTPAMSSVYVCTNETGALYINKSEPTEDEKAYFRALSIQDDVEKLSDEVETKYNEALESDDALAALMPTLKSQINQEVKDSLAAQQQADAEAAAAAEAEALRAAEEANAKTVRVTELVNIRASASTEAESLGKATAGMEFTRYEVMDNGWSRIDYNGADAYIKSDYLEEVVEEVPEEGSTIGASGKVTVKENVNIRETASESGNKLGVAYRGEQFDFVELTDGWCKIVYDGKDAYVKADFVE